jgi:hypothetical protein
MADTVIQYDEPVPARRPFQYSLRTLFIITTVLAILCAGLFAAPGWMRILVLIFWLIAYPIAIISLVIYGHGYLRSFSIGALTGIGPLIISQVLAMVYFFSYFLPGLLIYTGELSWDDIVSSTSQVGYTPGIVVFVYFFLSMLGGVVMVCGRWMIESYQRRNS